jgi:hypothetical protein
MFEIFKDKKVRSLIQRSQDALSIFTEAKNELISVNGELDQEIVILHEQIKNLNDEVDQSKNLKTRNKKLIDNISKIVE